MLKLGNMSVQRVSQHCHAHYSGQHVIGGGCFCSDECEVGRCEKLTLLLNSTPQECLCSFEPRLQLKVLPLRIPCIKRSRLFTLSPHQKKFFVLFHSARMGQLSISVTIHQTNSFPSLFSQPAKRCTSRFMNVEKMDCLWKGQPLDWPMNW